MVKLFVFKGLDEAALADRRRTVHKVLKDLIVKMVTEENELKKKLVDNSEAYLLMCDKLSLEMGVGYQQPDSRLTLMKLENALRREKDKLEALKKERMAEVGRKRKGNT